MHAYGSDKPFKCKWGCCVLKRFRMKSPSVKHRARQRGKQEIRRAMAEGGFTVMELLIALVALALIVGFGFVVIHFIVKFW